MGVNGMSKHDHILAGLVFSLQAATMQQLGKIQNPMTGEVERDLDQARGSIDILEMLKAKCRADTPEELLRMIDSAVMDLQLNYMDEMKKSATPENDEEGEKDAAADEESQNAAGDTGGDEADG